MNVTIMIACNNPRNGTFQGYVEDVCLELPDGESVELNGSYSRVRFLHENPPRMAISGVKFVPISHQEWVGNWCWDAVTVNSEDARRILNALKRRRWKVDCAPEAFHARWERDGELTADEWRDLVG